MKKNICVLFLVSLMSGAFAQQKHKLNYENGKTHIEYTTQNGMLNGPYTSYYANGIKKAEGSYQNNQRRGYWYVWDTLGNKRINRFFENAMDAKIVIAWDSAGRKRKAVPFGNTKYSAVDPVLGYKAWYPITEKEVLWSARIWRVIKNDSAVNHWLFDDNKFYKILYNGIVNREIKCYGDDEFQNTLDAKQIKAYENTQITEIRLKEDIYYNLTMNLAQTGIIGLAVVGMVDSKPRVLFWLYYPEVRGLLAKNKLDKPIASDITNYENILTERYFHSSPYKESNVYDREIKDYVKGADIAKEAERIEMTTLDKELEFWYKKIVYRPL